MQVICRPYGEDVPILGENDIKERAIVGALEGSNPCVWTVGCPVSMGM